MSCSFVTDWISRGERYSCVATVDDILYPDAFVTSIQSIHSANRSNEDVEAVAVQDQTTFFLLKGLTSFFPNIDQLYVIRSELIDIIQTDLENLSNLSLISLSRNRLSIIPVNTFNELINLEYLLLSFNQLTSIPNLQTLAKLKQVHLNENSITSLSSADFSNNLYLEVIQLQHNKIKFIDPNVFKFLPHLYEASLKHNKCINLNYTQNSTRDFIDVVDRQCYTDISVDEGLPSLEATESIETD